MTPKEEVEALMNEGLEFAETLLEKHGEFFPFALSMHPFGEIAHFAAYDGRERPPSKDVRKLLLEGLSERAGAGESKAIAVFSDVLLHDRLSGGKSDGVAVELEHQSGYSVTVSLPYTLAESTVTFGQPVASSREAVVFTGNRSNGAA